MGTFRPCPRCESDTVARCGRCDAPLCRRHRPRAQARCRVCERDYRDEAPVRNQVKALLGLPPGAIATTLVFTALVPFAGSVTTAIAVAACAAIAGTGTTAALFRAVDRAARAQFLREHGRPLPEARVVRLLPPHSR